MKSDSFSSQEGGCTCGEVRFRLLRKPLFIHCCHCSWCQRETGSAFALNALIEAKSVALLQGELEGIDTPSSSGQGQYIIRCKTCRVAVWSNYSAAGAKIHFVRVGTLDNPQSLSPDIHIFTSTKQPWVQLSNDIPIVEEYYQRSQYWPDESITRYKEAIGN